MEPRQEICRLERNLCITAGAGAGKTTAMVAAYVGLLQGNWQGPPLSPRQVVAITFTEKAAAEMRDRVLRQAAETFAGQPAWSSLLPALELAPICTIHGFCASLLREHGVALGLDPDFNIMEAESFAQLRQEVIQEQIRQGMDQGADDFMELLAHYAPLGRWGLEGMVNTLHDSLAAWGLGHDLVAQASAQAHQEALDAAPGLLAQLVQGVAELSRAGLENFDQSKKYIQNCQQLLTIWPGIFGRLQADPLDAAALEELAAPLKGGFYKLKPIMDPIKQAREGLEKLIPLPQAARLSQSLIRFSAQVATQVDRELGRLVSLSFDHLLVKARDLLRARPEVLAGLRAQYRVLMVDEFQDVNPVQGELVDLLAGLQDPPDYQAPAGEEPPRLLVVGDPKQSIYAFRGAEVELFGRFAARPGQAVVHLPENFRSARELVDFFNRVFKQIFATGSLRERHAGAYLTFSPQEEQKAAKEVPPLAGGAVQVLAVPGDPDWPVAQWRQVEAKALARLIQRLKDQGVAPGDMVILLRRLTQVAVYENCLRAAGIEHYTVRGRGFFDCREVADLSLALRALLDPGDDLALAGWLRSPLVGLSDETLLALRGVEERPQSLGRALGQAVELPDWLEPSQQERWGAACALYCRLSPLARRLQPAELIEQVVRASSLDALLMALPDGEQRLANLRKLIELAREPQGPLAGGMEAFSQGLAALVASPPNDPQAPLAGEEAHVVRLMTVHQAKGLQFPVVILPDLAGAPGGSGGLPPPGPSGVVSLAPFNPLTGKRPAHQVLAALREREKARQEAEEARVFYVACTRAIKGLILVLNQCKRQGAWGVWTRDILAGDPGAALLEPPDGEAAPSASAPTLREQWDGVMPPDPGPRATEGAALVERCSAGAGLAPWWVRESVSGLEDWLACPRRYGFTRLLGLDTAALARPGGWDAGPASESPAAQLGSLVHQVLEKADYSLGQSGLAPLAVALAGEDRPNLAAQVSELAGQFWRTGLPDLLAGITEPPILREQGFRLVLEHPGGGGLELRGEFDLLFFDAQLPGWRLVDYKVTPKLHPEEYRHQMAIYALALWRMQGRTGQAPRAQLCQLQAGQGTLVDIPLDAGYLDELETRLLRAARDIAALPAGQDPLDLPASPDCHRDGCPLGRSGLCPGREKA